MKQRNKAGTVAVLIFLSILFFGSSSAAQIEESGMTMRGKRLFEAVGLSDAQKADIDTLVAMNRENLRSLREQLREQREALRESVENQLFDETRVRDMAQAGANLQTQLLVARAYLMNQIVNLLTNDQKAKLAELREERRELMRERHEKRWRNPEQTQG